MTAANKSSGRLGGEDITNSVSVGLKARGSGFDYRYRILDPGYGISHLGHCLLGILDIRIYILDVGAWILGSDLVFGSFRVLTICRVSSEVRGVDRVMVPAMAGGELDPIDHLNRRSEMFACLPRISLGWVSYRNVLYSYRTVLYCTVLYCTVLYCTVLYCTCLLYTSDAADE